MVSLQEIQGVFNGTIKLGEPLAAYTSLGVGGPADYLLHASSEGERDSLVRFFAAHRFPCMIMQPNILVSERGFRGAVVVDGGAGGHAILKNGATLFKPFNNATASQYIEQADVNGVLWGGAEIVGNCLVNAHRATANELFSLAHHVRTIVQSRCGVLLEFDLQFVGFDQEALGKVA